MKHNRFTALLLCAPMLSAMTACGAGNIATADNSAKKLRIVCTIFPEYDWVKQILGNHAEQAELTYLLDSGMDLHSYQPTAVDMAKIADCDLFVYVGGESDEWAEDALAEAVNQNMQVINLLEVMGDAAKAEEVKEGMEHDHDHDHDHADEDHDEHDHEQEEDEIEYDEHVWLSLKNAKLLCTEIADKLTVLDSANAADYKANLETYNAQLDRLDSDFQTLTDSASQKTLVFGDRFPFRYLVDDYGLDYYAAFVGCSAETEASFETIVFLAEKTDELGCGTVFTIENSDRKIAQTIIDNTKDRNQTIAELNSLQSVTKDQIGSGVTYLSLMQQNYDVLKNTLQ
ncbi:MAG: zinc ABC transporter substrate-binding protein [Oscillospiraceae bacterium]|nr:zinc ABC transporter substrate-binding protein [Oscillospiraceae bacterium]